MQNDQDVAVYIGLDWGDRAHAVQLQPAAGGPVEQLTLEQRPHVLHGWVAQLRERFGGRPVGIAIEQRRGAVIHALMQYEFLVLYPVNPKALARYREAFHPSGAKDDPTDAALLLDLLRKHRDQLRPWHPDTVTARTLQLLCEHRAETRQPSGRPHEPDHQPAQAVFPPGPGLGRRARLAPSLRLSRQVAHAGRRPAGPPRHRAPVLSAAQLSARQRDRGPARRDGHRPAAHHRPGDRPTRSVWWSRATPPNFVLCSRLSTPSIPRSPPSSPPTPIRSCS